MILVRLSSAVLSAMHTSGDQYSITLSVSGSSSRTSNSNNNKAETGVYKHGEAETGVYKHGETETGVNSVLCIVFPYTAYHKLTLCK